MQWFIAELCLDSLFVIDLFINFLSAVEINDEEIDCRFKSIALYYLKGWFALDFIACLPFQLIETYLVSSGSNGGYNKLLRLARLPRLYRLLRILRLFKMARIFKNSASMQQVIKVIKMNRGITKLMKVAAATFLLVHLVT